MKNNCRKTIDIVDYIVTNSDKTDSVRILYEHHNRALKQYEDQYLSKEKINTKYSFVNFEKKYDKTVDFKAPRSTLPNLIKNLNEGDEVFVYSLLHLGYSLDSLILNIEAILTKGATIFVLSNEQRISTDESSDFLSVMKQCINLNKQMIDVRRLEGVDRATKEGRTGRPRVVSDEKIEEIKKWLHKKHASAENFKNISYADIAEACDMKLATLMAYKKKIEKESGFE